MPTVSVILLCYNQGEFLADAIESVLSQTFSDWELLIIDNGSTDGSGEIIARYRERAGVRVVLHPDNQSPCRRLNEGVRLAKGRYISLLYSDDFYLREKLERQVRLFASADERVGVVYSPGLRLNVSTGRQWEDPSFADSGQVLLPLMARLGQGGFMNPITPLMKRECFERFPFNENLFVEGEAIFLRFAIDFHFLYDATPTAVMRDHERNMGRSVRRNYVLLLQGLDELEPNPRLPPSAIDALRQLRVRILRLAGWEGVRTVNDPAWAREMFTRAIRADVRQALHPKVVIGLGLSLLPDRLRLEIHRGLLRLRRSEGHDNYVAE